MKNQPRISALFILLVLGLGLFSGCSQDAEQSSDVTGIELGADPVSTLLEVIAEPDRFVRTERLIAALRAVPTDQPEVFEEVLAGIEYPYRETARILVVTAWARVDAPAATRWAKNRERIDAIRDSMFGESVYLWALEDHESVFADMDMALYVLPGMDRSILRAFLKGWFDSGRPGIERYVHDLTPQSKDRQRAIDAMVEYKVDRDGPAAAIAWATNLPGNTRYKKSLYSRLAGRVVRADSKLAVDWCNEICDTEAGEDIPHFMAVNWVRREGEKAMDFIISRPNKIGIRTGARAAYRQFIIHEVDRAFAWMEATTEDQRRLPVMQGPVSMYLNKVSGVRNGKFLLAIEWLQYLQDEGERKLGLGSIMRRWLRADSSAAEAWMAQSSMTEEEKQAARDDSVIKRRGQIR